MGRPARSSLDGELAANARRLFISGDVVRGFLDGATAAEVRAANRLLSAELESRDVHRRERLMRRARFPQVKSFEGYDYSQVAFPVLKSTFFWPPPHIFRVRSHKRALAGPASRHWPLSATAPASVTLSLGRSLSR